MAVLSDNNLTLADHAKLSDPKGKPAAVAKLLTKTDDFWDHLAAVEANGVSKHVVSVETSLPVPTYRQYNEGTSPTKGTHVQVEEGMSMMEARTEVDVKLANLGNKRNHLRMIAADQKMRGMRYLQATTFFYGNASVAKATYNGLSVRYNSHTNAGNSDNVLNAGGSGADNTSIWLWASSPETFHTIFPEGSVSGLMQKDLGEDKVQKFDASGNPAGEMQAYCDIYNWDFGIALPDWRSVARICNIDVSDLNALTGTQASTAATNILDLMHDAFYRVAEVGAGARMCFAMNRTCHSQLSKLAAQKNSGALAYMESLSTFGTPRRYTTFMGIPIALTDSLILSEDLVAA